MRILMIGPFPPPFNGVTVANKMIFDGLNVNHKVYLHNTLISKKIRNVKQMGKINPKSLLKSAIQIVIGVLKILLFQKLDVIYITPAQSANSYLKYIPFMWAARVRKIPYVIHIHGGYFRKMYDSTSGWKRKIIDKSLKGLAGAIVLGPSLRYMFEGLIPNEKIFVCENGVEDEIFATEEEIKDKIARWKNDDTIRIIYLSNLLKTKGILDLLEAVKILKSEGKKVHLDVAGAIEPEIKPEVERYFSELGDAVTYHDVVKGQAKKKLLLDNYIFCLPSNHPLGEGQPISILEAMANGCAIVTTDHGGTKDIFKDGINGYYCKKKDPIDIKDKIKKACDEFPNFAMFNYKTALSKYTQESFVERIVEIISSKNKSC